MDAQLKAFHDELVRDIQQNRIILPSLPDVVLRIREAVNDPDADVNTIAAIVGSDATIAARLLKVASSTSYNRQGGAIDDLRLAVSKLGMTLVNVVVTNLAIIQVMRTPTPGLGKQLRELFDHSIKIAAASYAITKRLTRLNPEMAMLAGIVHDIGYLPILQKATLTPGLLEDEARLQPLLHQLHAPIGGVVLQSWGLNPDIITAVQQHEDLAHDGGKTSDLTDILIVAGLKFGHEFTPPLSGDALLNLPAFKKLGISARENLQSEPKLKQFYEEALSLLSV